MNYNRFIELLNLYLDHEISPEDARILEHEIRSNPERRKIYDQYCRIQKGTSALFEASRQEAPSPALTRSYAAINRRLARRHAEPSVSWWAWGTSGLLAAAACVTVVFVAQPNKPDTSEGALAAVDSSTTTSPVVASVSPSPQGDPSVSEPLISFRDFDAVNPALNQPVSFRPIAKVQNQKNLFTKDALPATEANGTELKLAPLQAPTAEEMTAVQFKR